MKVFGMKRAETTDEDRAAAARLSAVAARFKREPTYDLTESSPDPIGEPEPTAEAASKPGTPSEWLASGIADAAEEPETSGDNQEPDHQGD